MTYTPRQQTVINNALAAAAGVAKTRLDRAQKYRDLNKASLDESEQALAEAQADWDELKEFYTGEQ